MLLRVLRNLIGKRAPATSLRPGAPAQAAPDAPAEGAEDKAKALQELLEHAAGRVASQLPGDAEQRMRERAQAFTEAAAAAPGAPLHVFVYHVDMGDAGNLEYRDIIRLDTTKFDYAAVLRIFIDAVQRWQPDAVVFLATNAGSALLQLAGERVIAVPLDGVATDQPMYERVVTMCAYVHSAAFRADTLFLDSDAFLNAPVAPAFEADYDVGVTFRQVRGLMPVNEGVMMARVQRPPAVRTFFQRYLATFEALRADERVRSYYGDIRRWRGGQLSLNAVTWAAQPYSSYRQIDLGGVRLKALPCDPFNFTYATDDGAGFGVPELAGKVIVHLKGWRKDFLDRWTAYVAASARPLDTGPYVRPRFALANKEYLEPPFTAPAERNQFAATVHKAAQYVGANQPGTGALLADDMLVWFRNLAFLSDPEFMAALGPLADDPIIQARIWRVNLLCWAARNCLALEGDYIDVGCYDGKTVWIMQQYCGFAARSGKTWWLYDIFDAPPEESRKHSHGPQLFAQVQGRFEPLGNFRVIQGAVPGSFAQGLPQRIAFAQIDLNVAEAELAVLEAIYERIVPGGMIVFDDYGFRRYRATQRAETEFLAARGQFVWESPTGQGLLVKR